MKIKLVQQTNPLSGLNIKEISGADAATKNRMKTV
jgi:hypothetical protein